MAQQTPVVFISSTKEDLEAYRVAARDAAIRAGFLPRMMEYFVAEGAKPPYAECIAKVNEADVLVVIVAHRYGWVPRDQPGPKAKRFKSISWLECGRARKNGKQVLAFLVDEKHEWPLELRETHRLTKAIEEGKYTPELAEEVNRNVAKLKEFKQWLKSCGISMFFTNPDGLRADVEAALNGWREGAPGPAAASKTARQNPAKFLQWLREETAWIDIRGLQVGAGRAYRFPITDLYIPLTTADGGQQRGPGQETRGPVALEEALRHRRLVIVGDPGSGKTTFFRRVAHELSGGSGAGDLKLPGSGFPIVVRIAELEEHIAKCHQRAEPAAPTSMEAPAWVPHFLAERSKELHWDLDAAFFEKKLGEKPTYLLLDGLDEAPSRVRRERMARLFEQATRSNWQCRFAVTTRPQAYTGQSTLADFEQVRIDDLAPEAVEGFLGHWSRTLHPDSPARAESHRKELSDALHARAEIRRMARNPVMLTALAVVHWNEKRLPEQRAELYDSIVTWLARSREARPGRESADRCLELLGYLALAMQDQPKGRLTQVSTGPAAEMIARQFPDGEERPFVRAQSFLEQEEVDSGIIVSRAGELRFWHLTFQEYLAARAIAGLPDAAQHELLRAGRKLHRPEWREVMLLLGGILGVKQGRGKVDGLFTAVLGLVGPRATLSEKARCAGLLGAILADLRPLAYEPTDERYRQILDSVKGIFDPRRSAGIEFGVRLEAAEALGQAGDPRLREDNWATVPAGKFLMGAQKRNKSKPNYDPEADRDESPVREIELKTYQIGRYPVTVEEYRRFLEDDGYQDEQWWKSGGPGERTQPTDWDEQLEHPNRPVVNVTWYEAAAYCAWAGGRLPTEAEWERAARGLEGRKYPWGTARPQPEYANYDKTEVGHPTPVGLFPLGATPEGMQDLAGNVWEWIADWYEEDYYSKSPVENPRGPEQGELRVVRGASFYGVASGLRAASRDWGGPDGGGGSIGFRCVREVERRSQGLFRVAGTGEVTAHPGVPFHFRAARLTLAPWYGDSVEQQ